MDSFPVRALNRNKTIVQQNGNALKLKASLRSSHDRSVILQPWSIRSCLADRRRIILAEDNDHCGN